MEKGRADTNIGQVNLFDEIIVDNFAGGGGASTGIELACGRPVTIAINHDPAAILMHQTNHPYTKHIQASVWDVDPVEVCEGRPVGLAWFSPDCKHFSKAKGAAPVDRNIRGLAWIVLRWAGTVRPRVIILENVEEFQTWGSVRKGRPIKKRSGQTFQKWKGQLVALGYEIEHRELVAADYGAPTTRKRFVLIARCDGKPIVWPEPTHAPGASKAVKSDRLKPWVSAAEIIDWSVPMYSIFATKQEIKEQYGVNAVRPLASNTMRRIIRGVDKFTIRSGKPFLVECSHSAANLIQYHTEQTESVRANGMDKPLPTVDASNRYGLTSAHLVEYYGAGQPISIEDPMRTVTSHDREALTAVHLQKYFGGVIGTKVDEPVPTITAIDHNALAAAHIVKFKGQDLGQHPETPLQTITTSAGEFAVVGTIIRKYSEDKNLGHWPEVRTLLNRFCGYSLRDDEIILLQIGGKLWYISDISMRMLTPAELYRAMGFPPDYIIDRDYTGRPYPKTQQVARCGNAVCPPMATAVVQANLPEWCNATIETMEKLNQAIAL